MLASCIGQSTSPAIDEPVNKNQLPIVIGDTVSALGNNIMTIYQDKLNNYWFASWDDGLYKYDGQHIIHYSTRQGLPTNRIEDIQEDKSGNIYFNAMKGIIKFDGLHFINLSTSIKTSSDGKINPGDLWFRNDKYDGQLYRYDGKDLYTFQLPETEISGVFYSNLPKAPNTFTRYGVYCIYKDSKENVWFGTAALGACRYNGKTFDWISEEDVTELHNGPSNGVRSIIEDKDGYFWFNSMYRYKVYDTALSNFDSNKKSFYSREPSIGNIDGSEDSDFWEYLSIAKDKQGDLWIATYWNGVWRYNAGLNDEDGQGKDVTYYPVQADGKDITVFSIYKDNHGDLWLGTHENGAYKFNGKMFERFNP